MEQITLIQKWRIRPNGKRINTEIEIINGRRIRKELKIKLNNRNEFSTGWIT